MNVFSEIAKVRQRLGEARRLGKTVGLVPTMGSFHDGHLSLIAKAVADNDEVVVSVYVNPAQFGPTEDFDGYPRDIDRDVRLAARQGATIVFAPADSEMYPVGHRTIVSPETIAKALCGKSRPGHFDGVATVCAKLFNIIRPDRVYMGLKDYQQVLVVRQMIRDLDFDISVVAVPTVRDAEGLALSSRNRYLSEEERLAAYCLPRALADAQALLERGVTDVSLVRRKVLEQVDENGLVELEYLSFCDPHTLVEVESIQGDTLVAIAARVGRARLIDNCVLKAGELAASRRSAGSGGC
ncbi:MAG: pantoate--beta-alanine ligase [Terriglobia bacterium]